MCWGKKTANLEFYALLKYLQVYTHIHDTQGLRVYLSQKRNYFRRKLKLKAKKRFHRGAVYKKKKKKKKKSVSMDCNDDCLGSQKEVE